MESNKSSAQFRPGIVKGRCKFLKEWVDWPLEVHEEERLIDRQGRAMTYPFDFTINKKSHSGHFSSTTEVPFYKTTLHSCTCANFLDTHRPCKHIYRLAVELGYIEIIHRKRKSNKKELEEIRLSDNVDEHPDQLKRQNSAKKCTLVSIDYENRCGTFKGSGTSLYETTEEECTCRDYFVRRLPCKHVYRLRQELNERHD